MLVKKLIHPFHLVDESPYPLIVAVLSGELLVNVVAYMHGVATYFYVRDSLIILIIGVIGWANDIIIEASFLGLHTNVVKKGFRIGMLLFILSEIMFFISFFWAFFDTSLAPSTTIGTIWPPQGIEVFNPWEIPFLNTLILVTSGFTITHVHNILVNDMNEAKEEEALEFFLYTIGLGSLFTCLQIYEYVNASFNISDSMYGSVFFVATGFHGLHVLIGTSLLILNLIRYLTYQFTSVAHFGFEGAIWYWHFVDVIWIFLFISVYWWGN